MKIKTSKKRASAISVSLLFIFLAFNIYKDNWVPYFALTIGVPLACRFFLAGRLLNALISLWIPVGFVIVFVFELNFEGYIPMFFLGAASFILLREFMFSNTTKATD